MSVNFFFSISVTFFEETETFEESRTSQFQYALEILQNVKSLKTFFHKKSWLGENFRS